MARETFNNLWLVLALVITTCSVVVVEGFSNPLIGSGFGAHTGNHAAQSSASYTASLSMSSFSSDGSEYSSKDSDYDMEDIEERNWGDENYDEDEDDVETLEMKPVPMSKNAGNRFVALYWDHELEQNKKEGDPRESWWLHYDRDDLNEDHVMFCRKANLYNETFNDGSMVDVMRSLPM